MDRKWPSRPRAWKIGRLRRVQYAGACRTPEGRMLRGVSETERRHVEKRPPAIGTVLRSPGRWLATIVIVLVAAELAPAGPAVGAEPGPRHQASERPVSLPDRTQPLLAPGIATEKDVSVT